MGLFGCKACEAKDEDIAWLRATLEKERRFSAEIAKPGISRHIEPPHPSEDLATRAVEGAEEAKKEIRSAQPTFPGYEPMPESPKVEVT